MTINAGMARAFETTWPAGQTLDSGGLCTGRGHGAGGRVSSTFARSADWDDAAIAEAEAAHQDWAQPPMFRVSDTDDRLTAALIARGYRPETPTAIMVADIVTLASEVPRMTTFSIWPPLEIQNELWARGNIGPARQAVMQRVTGPKSAILGRLQDRAAGSAFIATDGDVAMLHAVEVLPEFRRMGLAGYMVHKAAQWAAQQNAVCMALAVGRANTGAIAAYDQLGFREVSGYSYFVRPQTA